MRELVEEQIAALEALSECEQTPSMAAAVARLFRTTVALVELAEREDLRALGLTRSEARDDVSVPS